MRIGFDVDGVLADFVSTYHALVIKHAAGVNLFAIGDDVDPPCWDWPQFRGYSDVLIGEVWKDIKASSHFWLNLAPLDNVKTLALMLKHLERNHDVYYITSRVGFRAKRQTEIWLFDHVHYATSVPSVWPTVCISSDKGAMAKALKLDVYVDDNRDNALSVAEQSPSTRNYLITKAYNVGDDDGREYQRLDTLGQVFDWESPNL